MNIVFAYQDSPSLLLLYPELIMNNIKKIIPPLGSFFMCEALLMFLGIYVHLPFYNHDQIFSYCEIIRYTLGNPSQYWMILFQFHFFLMTLYTLIILNTIVLLQQVILWTSPLILVIFRKSVELNNVFLLRSILIIVTSYTIFFYLFSWTYEVIPSIYPKIVVLTQCYTLTFTLLNKKLKIAS